MRVLWTARRSNQSILNEISPEYSLEGLMVKLKLQFFVTSWTAAHQASLTFTISQSLLIFMSIESKMPSNHLILCCPLFLPPSIFHSIRVFSNKLALYIRWPKYWSFSISPSNEHIQGCFLLRLTGLFSLLSKGLSRVFSSTTV